MKKSPFKPPFGGIYKHSARSGKAFIIFLFNTEVEKDELGEKNRKV